MTVGYNCITQGHWQLNLAAATAKAAKWPFLADAIANSGSQHVLPTVLPKLVHIRHLGASCASIHRQEAKQAFGDKADLLDGLLYRRAKRSAVTRQLNVRCIVGLTCYDLRKKPRI